jgi:Tfp pilus assembly protein PilX
MKNKGSAVILALVFLSVLGLVTAFFIANIISACSSTGRCLDRKKAFYIAEAGIDRAVYELTNTGEKYKGERSDFADGAFEVEIAQCGKGKDLVMITSKGYSKNMENPRMSTVVIQSVVEMTGTENGYSVRMVKWRKM